MFQKFDTEKPQWDLFPWQAAEQVVRVLEHGAQKYGKHNWKKAEGEEGKIRYLNAALRHLLALYAGEEVDPDSGLPHTAHLGCNALFLGELYDVR